MAKQAVHESPATEAANQALPGTEAIARPVRVRAATSGKLPPHTKSRLPRLKKKELQKKALRAAAKHAALHL